MPVPQPFSVPDPDAEAWADMVRRNQLLQAGNDPLAGGAPGLGDPDDGYAGLLNNPEVSMDAWLGARNAQLSGAPWDHQLLRLASASAPATGATVSPVIVRPATPTAKPLTGRPGLAAGVAGALNAITAGPNTVGQIHDPKIQGTITRGSGRDIAAHGKVGGFGGGGARGVLDPPSGQAEISASEIKGEGILGLPSHMRIYNTPGGELDVDLPGPIKVGPLTVRPGGAYRIGAPDTPKRK